MTKQVRGANCPTSMLRRILPIATVLLVAAMLIAPVTAADVAQIKDGGSYATLQGAIDAVADDGTVTLLSDVTEQILINKNLTLVLGEYTITGNTEEQVLRIYSPVVDTTINVTIDATIGGITNTGIGYAIYAGEDLDGGDDAERTNLIINGGNYVTEGTDCIKQIMGLCTINDGTYKSTLGRTVLNGKQWYGAEFAINGGSFYGFNPACVSVWTGFNGKDYTNFYHQHDIIADGKTAEFKDGWYNVVDGTDTAKVSTKSLCYPSVGGAIHAIVNMKDVGNLGVITLLGDDTLTEDDAALASATYTEPYGAGTKDYEFSFILGSYRLTLPESYGLYDDTLEDNRKVKKIGAYYTITFETNGGTEISPIKSFAGASVTVPDEPTKTGYRFDGWDKAIPSTMPPEDMTITAKWTANTYTITFDGNGKTGGSTAGIGATYDKEYVLTNGFTNSTGTFAGWATEMNGAVVYANESTVKNLATKDGDEVTLYAIWTDKEVLNPTLTVKTVTYNGEPQTFDLDGYDISYQQNGLTVTAPKDAGSYDVIISKAEDDNYAAYQNTFLGGLVIEKEALTATYAGETIQYGETPELLVEVTGFVPGETAESLEATDDYTAPTVQNSNNAVGSYVLTPSGGSATNYDFTSYVSGTLVIESVTYPIKEGKDMEIEAGSAATFVSEVSYADFEKVLVDGNEVDSEHYTVISGSTKVILKASYISTLSAGPHTITIVSKGGSASTPFTVVAQNTGNNPGTGSSPSSGSSSSGSSVWLQEPAAQQPTQTPTETEKPTDTVPTDIPVTQPTATPATPGFGVLAVLAGLGAVAVLRRR